MICLDTNVIITLFNVVASPVEPHLRAALRSSEPVTISTVVLFELWWGAAKSARADSNFDRIRNFLTSPVQVLPFDAEDAREAGDIRAALQRAGTPIGPYDILIAAQARRRGATLITANAREFARVPGLRTEDWAG
jgi:tRNA(fMet)-specific endonuclease VapC